MKVKLGLDRLSAGEKVAIAKAIKAAMTTNATTFNAPMPSMPALGTLITSAENGLAAYDTATQAAGAAMEQRDAAVTALSAALMQEASYVDSVAAGDPVKIALAGMGVKGDGAPVGPMPRVADLALTPGDHDGTLDAMWHPVYGVKSYEVWTSPDPMTETGWKFLMTTPKSSATLKGLASASKVWIRVRAIGADPEPGAWSDPATKVVP